MLLDENINMWEENNQYTGTQAAQKTSNQYRETQVIKVKHSQTLNRNILDKTTPTKYNTSKHKTFGKKDRVKPWRELATQV